MTRVAILLVAGLLSGCSSTAPDVDSATADEHLGKVVSFQGKAVNARLSAAVVSDGFLLYCIEIPEWTDEVAGRTVRVTGRLDRTDQFKARTGPSGERTAGTSGGDYVLRSVSHQVE